jgi:hypothetical protein
VLGHNYPGSESDQDSYALLTGIPFGNSDEAPSKSWISRVIGSLF